MKRPVILSLSILSRLARRRPGGRPCPARAVPGGPARPASLAGEAARVEAVRRGLLRARPQRGREPLRGRGVRRRLQGPDALDRRDRGERRGLPRGLLRSRRRERRRPGARRAALAPPEGGSRLRPPARGRLVHPLAHRAVAPRGDPRPRHPAPRRLAPRARELLELRPAGPARAEHGQDALPRHRGRHAPGEGAGAPAGGPRGGRRDARGARLRAGDRGPELRLLARREDRPPEVARAEPRAHPRVQAADRPGERPAPAGRPHGDRGPHPPRPGRPGVRPRHGSDRGGGGARRRPAGRSRARGRPRRGAVPVQPPPRAVQAAGGALGPRREGEGALRGQARRRRRPRRASRRRPRRLRRVPLGRRGDARLVGEAAEDGLAPRLAAVPARAPARAARHPGRARRDPREGPGHAPRRRQRRALPARPAVPGRAAAHDPRRRGLPRPLAARLRRRRPRGRPRRDRVLHQRRGLPRGADEAGARVRPDGEAPHLHDPRRPQLLGGQPGPALHRRAAGPARRAPAPAEAGRRAGPEDAGRHRRGAAEAARGGGRVEGPAGGGGPARPVVAARLRRRPPQRDEPGRLLLPHAAPGRLPADRPRHDGARPPQDRLPRPQRARPREGRGPLRRRRRGRAVHDGHVGGPRRPPSRPGGGHAQGGRPALPGGERLHGPGHAPPPAGPAEASRLRGAGAGPGGQGVDGDGDAGAQRDRLRAEETRPWPRRCCTR